MALGNDETSTSLGVSSTGSSKQILLSAPSGHGKQRCVCLHVCVRTRVHAFISICKKLDVQTCVLMHDDKFSSDSRFYHLACLTAQQV